VTSPTLDLGAEAVPAPTIKKRAIEGTVWTVVGYGAQQVLRLGSNLVLTRLLAPEAFGLMALVFVFVTGLEMLSDVGVGPAIIQSARGDNRRLLDTAWTVQIIRGVILAIVALLVAWPAARLYAEPRLTALVTAAGIGMIVRGFTPTRVHSLNRKVLLARVTMMELSTQVVSIAVTIAAAFALRSAWALLVGALAGDVARVSLSYLILPGHRHRFAIDRDAVHEIIHIGRWILLSTAVTFFAGNLDRLAMGRLLSVKELGIYSIASQLALAVTTVGRTVGSRVLFPVLAETIRDRPALLYARLRTARTFWIVPTVLGLAVLAVGGDFVVRILYSARYQDAGWMLRILAAGSIFAVVNQATGVIWPSLGDFRMSTVLMMVQVPLELAAMLVGFHLHGIEGFVIGCVASEMVMYPVQSFLVARRRLWQPELDLPVLAASALIVVAGVLLR
jgi:O-antigen/teichoic acid export membrane protein